VPNSTKLRTISHYSYIYYGVSANSGDVALAFDSYDHWQDQPNGLEEVRRSLKSNGRFVVVKDGGLPNGYDAKNTFLAGLTDAGFNVVEEQKIQEDDVILIFTQLICAAEG
jgi:SAM-dependent methyltransferase